MDSRLAPKEVDMTRTTTRSWLKFTLGAVSIAVALGLYSCASHVQQLRNPGDTTVPSLRQLGAAAKRVVTVSPARMEHYRQAKTTDPKLRRPRPWLWTDVKASFLLLLCGACLGGLMALGIGLLMERFDVADGVLSPWVTVLARVPVTYFVLLPVFFIMFGTGPLLPIAGATMVVFSATIEAVRRGVRRAREDSVRAQVACEESTWRSAATAILPEFLDRLSLGVSLALVFVLFYEFTASDVGFGYRIRLQMRLLNMDVVCVYWAFLVVFTLAFDYGLRILRRRLFPTYSLEVSRQACSVHSA